MGDEDNLDRIIAVETLMKIVLFVLNFKGKGFTDGLSVEYRR